MPMEPHQAPSRTPQDQFLAACELLKAGKIVEATWAAEALINQFPKSPVGHLLRSMVHERQHNLPAATSEIEAALERAPQDPLALATAARIAFHRGDFSTTQAMADRISRDAGAWRDGQWWKARASNAMEHPRSETPKAVNSLGGSRAEPHRKSQNPCHIRVCLFSSGGMAAS